MNLHDLHEYTSELIDIIIKFKEANVHANLFEYSDKDPDVLEDKVKWLRKFQECNNKLDEHIAVYVNKYTKF